MQAIVWPTHVSLCMLVWLLFMNVVKRQCTLRTAAVHERHALARHKLTTSSAVQLCCMAKHWRVSRHAIDVEYGCCGNDADSMLLSSVRDIQFEGSLCERMFCCGRANVRMHDGDPTSKQLNIKTTHAKRLYHTIRDEMHAQRRHHAHDAHRDFD